MSTTKETALEEITLLSCKGFEPKFINGKTNISLTKILSKPLKAVLPKVKGNKKGLLNYTNLTIAYDSERKIPYFAAYNLDGSLVDKKTVRLNRFLPDPRIGLDLQLNKNFYAAEKGITEFAVGHMASHKEVSWGKDSQTKSYQSFFYPNSVPQAVRLNSGLWKSLETYIIEETSEIDQNKKICVFTGPFILKNDPIYIHDETFRIPILFFKVIIFSTEKGLFSTAFVMSHEERIKELNLIKPTLKGGFAREEISEFADFKYKKVFQVNISLLEESTGLKFSWSGVKPIKVQNSINQLKIIKSIKDANDAGNQLKNSNKLTPQLLAIKIGKMNIILP